MKVQIDIDTKTFVRFWLVVIGFLIVAIAIYSMRTALIIIGAAAFLAIALSPIVNRLTKRLPNKNRVLASAMAYIVVVAALGAIVFLVVPPIVSQTVKFIQNVPDIVNSVTDQNSGLSHFIDNNNLRSEYTSFIESIKNSTASLTSGIGTTILNGIGSILTAITSAILILVLTFLMLVEAPKLTTKLWRSYGDQAKMRRHKDLLGKMYSVVTRYVTGQLTVSAIASIFAGVLVFILSVIFHTASDLIIPAAAIIFVLSLIPLFGEITGAVIISLFLAFNNLTLAIIFIIFFIVYAQVEANAISPKIQSKRIELSPLLILIAVTIGIYIFGIIGGIISIPIAGCIKVLVEYFTAQAKNEHHKNRKKNKSNSIFKKV